MGKPMEEMRKERQQLEQLQVQKTEVPVQEEIQAQPQLQQNEAEQPPEAVIPPQEDLYVERKQDKHGNTIEKLGRLKNKVTRVFRGDRIRAVTHGTLREACRTELERKGNSSAFKNAVSAVKDYAALDLDTASLKDQYAKLDTARGKMKTQQEVLQKDLEKARAAGKEAQVQKLTRELTEVERLQRAVAEMADGRLQIPDRREPAWHEERWRNTNPTFTIKSRGQLLWKDVSEQSLFPHEPSIGDIQQGGLGDCYLLSALGSILAERPGFIKESMKDNKDGTVTVRFFQEYQRMEDLPEAMYGELSQKPLKNMTSQEILMRMMTFTAERDQTSTGTRYGRKRSEIPAHVEAEERKEKEIEELKKRKAAGDTTVTDAQIEAEETALTALQKQPYAEGRTAVEKMFSLFALADAEASKKRLLKYPGKYRELAETMAADGDFSLLLDKCKELAGQNEDMLLDEEHMYTLLQEFDRLYDAEQVKALQTKYQGKWDEMDGTAEMHPVYVTVKKEIPVWKTLFGGYGDPAYNNGPLWVHMLEKAFAAAGLNSDEAFRSNIKEQAREELSKLPEFKALTEEARKVRINAKVRRMMIENQNSYEQIRGGTSADFLRTYMGAEEVKKRHDVLTALNAMVFTNDFWNKVTREPAASPNWGAYGAAIRVAVHAELEKQGKEIPRTNQKYVKGPMSIEDYCEVISSFWDWCSAELKEDLLRNEKGTAPGRTEQEMAETIRAVAKEYASRLAEEMHNATGKFQAQHRLFGEDSGAPGKYTVYAETCYEKIKTALEEGRYVGMGTREFVPRSVSSRGLNGEAMGVGLAAPHGYTVLGCVEIQGHKYVQVRNPWGNKVRGYKKIIKEDGSVSYRVKEIDKKKNQQGGQFLMELNDFMNYSSMISGIE